MAAPHIEAGRLVPLFPAKQSTKVEAHFVVYPKRHAKRKEVAMFLAWLKRQT
jgi:LysR family glycine cleavage system transcriptional activator